MNIPIWKKVYLSVLVMSGMVLIGAGFALDQSTPASMICFGAGIGIFTGTFLSLIWSDWR